MILIFFGNNGVLMKLLFLILFSVQSLLANTELESILDRIDKIYRSQSSIADMSMIIKTPHWERTLELKAWTKGMKNTFIRILLPKKEQGVATLKKNNEMWNYFPRVNKVIKVPPSMMMGSWMGSDFTNDDLVKENTLREDYKYKIIKTEGDQVSIELIPHPDTITVWGRIILLADKKRFIPLLQEYYDEKGKKVRSMHFDHVQKVDGLLIPMRMKLVSLSKPGHETTIIYQNLKLNAGIKDSVFSIKNLQKRK
jgi:outer membrane lipoprotein-sorting protein